jgi:hypothetical protein
MDISKDIYIYLYINMGINYNWRCAIQPLILLSHRANLHVMKEKKTQTPHGHIHPAKFVLPEPIDIVIGMFFRFWGAPQPYLIWAGPIVISTKETSCSTLFEAEPKDPEHILLIISIKTSWRDQKEHHPTTKNNPTSVTPQHLALILWLFHSHLHHLGRPPLPTRSLLAHYRSSLVQLVASAGSTAPFASSSPHFDCVIQT